MKLPGLIDSHVHLAKVPSMNGTHKRRLPELVASYARQQPRSYLYFGYTTLVDLNVFNRRALAEFSAQPLHPRVHTCGKHLDIANGHGMFEEAPKTRLKNNPNYLYDHYQNLHLGQKFNPRKDTAAATVANIEKQGGICIKS